ncbi:tRNA (N6-threonylcarbamoyladenosine(37)-N6)-methyltransferase TrmO [Methanobacterium sp. BAmetb5]|jgi:tRNA-Thr(GGU) m(6)t(6)A37 methyltransferase TsaA|uniref:tRNA (N6-threonylcarbamoyladenosine(37)-N6)-methyltransferase TrmO n=1 Tax=Methanobacterium sp. BAmetb5 TaxID=2025351 RepID=UPI000E7EFF1A|nr:tRNA (N6-threonylcarbamoyladenosine(37)-N6)-methyltransferase TrmO [Methanobacterium sp. BAmetb5]AXV38975.1 MAG: tRNA (N6-threonylcarbamoyladenosine(37)-N6)-methyltransferase TrmO [Methanobacterium sp. BAmetb5]
MQVTAIGRVNSPFKAKKGSPHQGRFSDEVSTITIFPEYAEALEGIESGQNLHVIYWMDRADSVSLKVVPYGGTEKRGVFSTRAPVRPNPMGLCLVKLVQRQGNILRVKWLDALDGSPVLDIKPFWEEIDCP